MRWRKNKIKVLCIIQARLGSRRLPNKVLMEVSGLPLLEYEIMRVKQAKLIDKIVIAATSNDEDEKIGKLAGRVGLDCFRGSVDDVLDRFYLCALKYHEYNTIVRITGDCPLVDPKIIDQVIELFINNKYDMASNVEAETFPDGMDIEVFKRSILIEAALNAKLSSEREHVTPYIRQQDKYKKGNLAAGADWSHFRLTVDNQEDFEVVKFVIERSKPDAGYLDYISLLIKNQDIMRKNMHISRNEGLIKSLEEDKII